MPNLYSLYCDALRTQSSQDVQEAVREGNLAPLFIESGLIELSFDRKHSISLTVATLFSCTLDLLVVTDSTPSSPLIYEGYKIRSEQVTFKEVFCRCNN